MCWCGFFYWKNATWNLSLVNSSSMQHNTRTYQAWVLCKYKTRAYCSFFSSSMVLELGKLEFLVIWNSSLVSSSSLYFFFPDHLNTQVYVFIYLKRSIVKYKNFNTLRSLSYIMLLYQSCSERSLSINFFRCAHD